MMGQTVREISIQEYAARRRDQVLEERLRRQELGLPGSLPARVAARLGNVFDRREKQL